MKKYIPLFIGLDIFILDLFTKYLAVQHLPKPMQMIEGVFSFEYYQNSGIAFSIPLPISLQIFFSVLLLLFLLMYAKRKTKHMFEKISIAFVVSGAFGNLFERIFFGHVTDFISVWKFPVFNLADTFIFLGVIGLLLFESQQKKIQV